VVGYGRAGRARVRAIEAHPGAALTCIVSREGGDCARLRDALDRPDVDAVVVCTPNMLHPEPAHAALHAGKHVCVEFPLAPSVAKAQALFAHARATGRVLHTGHIELLAPSQRMQRERLAALGPVRGGELVFTGGADGWIGDDALAGSPALRAVARLHRLVDLLGPATVTAASLERDGAAYALAAELAFGAAIGGGAAPRVVLCEKRGPDLPRATHWSIACANGVLDDPPDASAHGVFLADVASFVAQVVEGAPSYVTELRILHVLALVEQIDARVRA
jgi:predicted dehydrogenase